MVTNGKCTLRQHYTLIFAFTEGLLTRHGRPSSRVILSLKYGKKICSSTSLCRPLTTHTHTHTRSAQKRLPNSAGQQGAIRMIYSCLIQTTCIYSSARTYCNITFYQYFTIPASRKPFSHQAGRTTTEDGLKPKSVPISIVT